MIIDIHAHVPPRHRRDQFLRDCASTGTAICVVSCLGADGWPGDPDPDTVRAANAEAADFAGEAPAALRWFAYLNPRHPGWPEEWARCRAAGAVGIKLWISLKDDSGIVPGCDGILAAAAESGLPVLVHTWNRTDGNLPGELDFREFVELAARHPRTSLIAAHAGANWRTSIGLGSDLRNISVDVSGGYPARGMLEDLVHAFGPDRVLYGSDAPGRSMASQLAKVTLAHVPARVKRLVLCENAARMLSIPPCTLGPSRTTMASRPSREPLPLPSETIDHFCFCGRWPHPELEAPTPEVLDRLLADNSVNEAFVASAEAIFALDVCRANRAFAADVAACSRVRPLAVLTPFAPNSRVVLDAAVGLFPGGIVFPYLHRWRLDDPAFRGFFSACGDASLPLHINVSLGDHRMRHPSLGYRPVTPAEAAAFYRSAPPNRYVVQGAGRDIVDACLQSGPLREDFRFDISRLSDNSFALTDLIGQYGSGYFVLGSEYPLRHLLAVRLVSEYLCGVRRADVS